MNLLNQPLAKAPIVEAVVDIDVEMRPGFVLSESRELLNNAFRDRYPVTREREFDAHEIRKTPGAVGLIKSQSGLESLMFIQNDDRQLVQARRQGFSFNRLAPYEGFDQYKAEIDLRWKQFCDIVKPVRVAAIRMRFINRIEIPLENGQVDLDQYLRVGPRAPDEDAFAFMSFSSRSVMTERATGIQVIVSLASRQPSADFLPVILDVEVAMGCECDASDLNCISDCLAKLRATKNVAFQKSLEDRCLALFN